MIFACSTVQLSHFVPRQAPPESHTRSLELSNPPLATRGYGETIPISHPGPGIQCRVGYHRTRTCVDGCHKRTWLGVLRPYRICLAASRHLLSALSVLHRFDT